MTLDRIAEQSIDDFNERELIGLLACSAEGPCVQQESARELQREILRMFGRTCLKNYDYDDFKPLIKPFIFEIWSNPAWMIT